VGIGESLRNLGSNPVSLVPMLFTVAGILLNFSGLPRPWVLNYIANRYMTYISAAGFSFAIGLGFDLRVSLGYRRHALLIALVKFVFTPLAALALTAAFGLLGGLETGADPLPALVVLVESAMPTAILALVAVKLFGLNEHLANAAWIFTTLLAIGVIGLQFAVLRWAVPYLF
jgi:predicted permease